MGAVVVEQGFRRGGLALEHREVQLHGRLVGGIGQQFIDADRGVDPARERRQPLLVGVEVRPALVDRQQEQEAGQLLALVFEVDALGQRQGVLQRRGLGRRPARGARADVQPQHAVVAVARLDARDDVEPFVLAGALDLEIRHALRAHPRLERLQVGPVHPLGKRQPHHPVVKMPGDGTEIGGPSPRRQMLVGVRHRPRAVEQLGGGVEPRPDHAGEPLRLLLKAGLVHLAHRPPGQPPGGDRDQNAGDKNEERQETAARTSGGGAFRFSHAVTTT